MQSRVPLPVMVHDVGPGGGIPSAVNALNVIQKQNLENRYAPLEHMIKAQNALAYGSKGGAIGQFLRTFGELPVIERQAYMADPTNRKNMLNMLEQFRSSINQPGGANSILTPQNLQSMMGGSGGGGGGGDILSWIGNKMFGGQPQNPMAQAPQAPQPQQAQSNPMAQLNQGIQDAQQGQQPTQTANLPNVPPEMEEGYVPPPKAETKGGNEIDKIPSEKDIFDAPTKMSPEERGTYAAQLIDNNKRIGTKLLNRADNAIAFDAFMLMHRKKIAKVMNDYANYSRLYGNAKKWWDKFKIEQPEEYANLLTATESILPLISNGIRYMEGMGESHQAQEHALQQARGTMGDLTTSPETAIKVFNNHMQALNAVSEGVLRSAEPAHPGARRKLANLPEFPDEYIPVEKKGKGNNQAPGTVKMRGIDPKDKKMKTWVVPEDQASVYETEGGFKRVGK